MKQRFVIPGSETSHSSGGSWLPVDSDLEICPTIVIRRPKQAGDIREEVLSGSFHQMSRAEAEQLLQVDAADLAAVRSFVEGYGLKIKAESAEARTMRVEGSVMRVGQAFGVDIEWRIDPDGQKYLSYQGPLTVPAAVAGIIEAVLGLDQRRVATRGAHN
jgi:kumamolisin